LAGGHACTTGAFVGAADSGHVFVDLTIAIIVTAITDLVGTGLCIDTVSEHAVHTGLRPSAAVSDIVSAGSSDAFVSSAIAVIVAGVTLLRGRFEGVGRASGAAAGRTLDLSNGNTCAAAVITFFSEAETFVGCPVAIVVTVITQFRLEGSTGDGIAYDGPIGTTGLCPWPLANAKADQAVKAQAQILIGGAVTVVVHCVARFYGSDAGTGVADGTVYCITHNPPVSAACAHALGTGIARLRGLIDPVVTIVIGPVTVFSEGSTACTPAIYAESAVGMVEAVVIDEAGHAPESGVTDAAAGVADAVTVPDAGPALLVDTRLAVDTVSMPNARKRGETGARIGVANEVVGAVIIGFAGHNRRWCPSDESKSDLLGDGGWAGVIAAGNPTKGGAFIVCTAPRDHLRPEGDEWIGIGGRGRAVGPRGHHAGSGSGGLEGPVGADAEPDSVRVRVGAVSIGSPLHRVAQDVECADGAWLEGTHRVVEAFGVF